jgi:hypothetical protein
MKWILFLLSILVFTNSFAQQGSEILLFDLSIVNGQVVISNGSNISNHKGYDNQPCFHTVNPIIYYSSFNDSGRSDIKYYNYLTTTTTNLTNTTVREYSPTVTPDNQSISCIIQTDNGAQHLGKYPMDGGDAELLIQNLVIGYHAWIDHRRLLLFVLGDSNNHSLHYYDLETKDDRVIASKIGRSLHKIPGRKTMSFVQVKTDSASVISEYNPASGATRELLPALKGSDHVCWLNDEVILMSNATGIYYSSLEKGSSWKPVKISGLQAVPSGITRMATNTSNTKLAIVVRE